MKTRFEIWINDNDIPNDSVVLFKEAVLCYKSSAYRASFLMTYLGMHTAIRNRLLFSSEKPNSIDQSKWTEILSIIKDDDKWDQKVFELVQRNANTNPFLINEDIKYQYAYWKTIRNACAHAKDNEVSYPHVEALWLFIESNLNKFIINGGADGLLEKIKKHFDPVYTAPGKDPEFLVELIPLTIEKSETRSFFKAIHDYFETHNLYLSKDNFYYTFWSLIVKSPNTHIRNSFIEFIKCDWSIFLEYIVIFPEIIYEVSSDEEFIREFWSTKIWRLIIWGEEDGWILLVSILDNEIIPVNEIQPFIEKLYTKLHSAPPDLATEVLKKSGYFKLLKFELFEKKKISGAAGIDFANKNWDNIIFFLKHESLDKLIVTELNTLLSYSYYGTFFEKIKNLIKTNKEFRRGYISILQKEDLTFTTVDNDEGNELRELLYS